MKIGEQLSRIINEFRSQIQQKDKDGNLILTAKVDPNNKTVISFLLELSSSKLQRPYNEAETEIHYDGPFNYKIMGENDKIALTVHERFFRHGGNLEIYFEKLLAALDTLIKDLSEGWVINSATNLACDFIPLAYENPNISGTYYEFMLSHLANTLNDNHDNKNQLIFSTWLPGTTDHIFANKIYMYGDKEISNKFLASIADELSMDSKLFINEKISAENTHHSQSVTISLTNYPRGTTFIQIMSLNNERDNTHADVTLTKSNTIKF